MSKRRKPYDPNSDARAQERAAAKAESIRIRAQGGEVRMDAAGRIISAWRSNVFRLLLERGTITANHHDAAYTLANDWAQWKGLDGKPEISPGRVDQVATSKALVTDRMVRAGQRVEAALAGLEPWERAIVAAFMVAVVEEDRPMQWRGIVERVTGLKARAEQEDLVWSGLERLRAHYQDARPHHVVAA